MGFERGGGGWGGVRVREELGEGRRWGRGDVGEWEGLGKGLGKGTVGEGSASCCFATSKIQFDKTKCIHVAWARDSQTFRTNFKVHSRNGISM